MEALSVRPIRVALVDDHQIILDGLVAMLRAYAERVRVVGQTTDPERAGALLSEVEPDICILDVRLGATSGLDLCLDLRRRAPECRIVFLTVHDDEQYLFQSLRIGASGYLLKEVGGSEFVAHLERVMDGEIVVDPALAGRLALSADRLSRGEFWPGSHLGLTRRESEILGLVVLGLSNQEIAHKLIVGGETVKSHVRSIYRKLGVGGRPRAVAAALRQGLFP